MTTLRERVAGERKRLKSVREALSAAVARTAQGDAAFVPFYVAVSDYMEASMGRLHAQDVKMGDMIREKVGKIDASVTQALGELDERLAGNQRHLADMLAARTALTQSGTAALPRFEKAAAAYTNYIVTNMGHHGATTDLAAKLFSQADWEYMAGVSDADMQREQQLYARVRATVPAPLKDHPFSA